MNDVKGTIQYQVAKILLGSIPPILAQRLRSILYPLMQARKDSIEFINYSKTGSIFKGNTNDFHAYPFSIHGYYEWRNIAIAKAVCQPGDEIIEVGANIGTETVGYADAVTKNGKVHAFEPIEKNLRVLKEIIRLNNFEHLLIYPYAVGNAKGIIKFVHPPVEMSGMGHVLGIDENPGNDVISLECYPLDFFASKISRLAAIFIDVEGFDLLVVRGAHKLIQLYRPVIVLEVSIQYMKRHNFIMQDITAELDQLNYTYYSIGRLGLAPINTQSTRSDNWVCIPNEKNMMIKGINEFLFYSGVFPFFGKLNPLSR
jgi:FkbM family methyltransferase